MGCLHNISRLTPVKTIVDMMESAVISTCPRCGAEIGRCPMKVRGEGDKMRLRPVLSIVPSEDPAAE